MGVIAFLARHGVMLLSGTTLLLTAGTVAVALVRRPIYRQRLGELTVMGVLIWLAAACVPLQRASVSALWPHTTAPTQPPSTTELAIAVPVHDVQSTGIDSIVQAPAPPAGVGALGRAASFTGELGGFANADPLPLTLPPLEPDTSSLPTTPASDESPARREGHAASVDWPELTVRLLGAGAAACTAWLLLGRVLLTRILLSATPVPCWLSSLYEGLPWGAGRRPRLITARRCRQAFTCGALKSKIVVPARWCTSDNERQLRHVLLHELGHVRQRDAWGQWLFNLALPVLYAHPIYWWLRRQVRWCAELLADDWAAGHSAKDAYAEDLVALVNGTSALPLGYLGVLGVSAPATPFYRRMEMLLQREEALAARCSRRSRWLLLAVWGLAVALAAGTLGVQPGLAQEEEAKRADARRDEGAGASTTPKQAEAADEVAQVRKERDALRKQVDELARQAEALAQALEKLQAAQAAAAKGQVAEAQKQAAQAKQRAAEATEKGKEWLQRQELQAQALAKFLKENPTQDAETGKQLRQLLDLLTSRSASEQQELSKALAAQQAEALRRRADAARVYDEAARRQAEINRDRDSAAREAARRAAEYQEEFEAQTRVGSLLRQAQGRSGESGDLDAVINLATQLAAAKGDLDLAEARMVALAAAEQQDGGVVSQSELGFQKIKVEAARRKVTLFAEIARAVEQALFAELELLQESLKGEDMSRSEQLAARSRLAQAEAKLRILRLAYESVEKKSKAEGVRWSPFVGPLEG